MAASETALIMILGLATFARAAIRVFCLTGVFVPGAMVLALPRRAQFARPACDTMHDANTVVANLCVLCDIVHGAIGKSGGIGRFDLFQRYAAVAAGR